MSRATKQRTQRQSSTARRVSRRRLLGGGAAATAAFFTAHATGNFSLVHEASAQGRLPRPTSRPVFASDDFTDEPFDPDAVQSGEAGWFPSPYGADDQLGTLNEVTPEKAIQTWTREIRASRSMMPKTYNMGEIMEPGIPAFPGRAYVQSLQGPTESPPFDGDNQINGAEERIETTYHIATQIDGLPHIGVGTVFYNGTTIDELVDLSIPAAQRTGVERLGQELVDPFVTRGILLDVLSIKLEEGDDAALGERVDGAPNLANSYRITVEDLQNALDLARVREIDPGDVVVIRTGWTHLFDPVDEEKKARYLATEPGIYLREARWLAQFRPAVVASDTWALELLPPPEGHENQLFPVHQELLTHHGIRIGEAFVSEELAADEVYRFVFFYTGQRARGATAANVAPGAFGVPTRGTSP